MSSMAFIVGSQVLVRKDSVVKHQTAVPCIPRAGRGPADEVFPKTTASQQASSEMLMNTGNRSQLVAGFAILDLD
jgi:hypothetical protein